jgi:hypothetical protein
MSSEFNFGNEEHQDQATSVPAKQSKNGKKKKGGILLLEKGGVNIMVNKLMNRAPTAAPSKVSKDIRIEDLDESVLVDQLSHLEVELVSYKAKCEKLKVENEWYASEVQSCMKDTSEYIEFLEAKKNEKVVIITDLAERNKKILEEFKIKKQKKEDENQAKIDCMLTWLNLIKALRNTIDEIDTKAENKTQEIAHLSDIMLRKSRHEAEIFKIRKEMAEAETLHKQKIGEIERKLLEARLKSQREADAKVNHMQV